MWRCFSSLTRLQELHTWNLDLADIPGEVLLLPQLTSLRLKECNGYNGLDKSMDLSPLQNLVELDIWVGNFEGVPVMLTTCQSLEVVKLDWCHLLRVSRAGIDVLKTLPHLKKLTIIHRLNPVAIESIARSTQDIVHMVQDLLLVDFEFDIETDVDDEEEYLNF